MQQQEQKSKISKKQIGRYIIISIIVGLVIVAVRIFIQVGK